MNERVNANKKSKARSGVTLVELIAAVAILAIAFIPIFVLMGDSVRFNTKSHMMSAATLAVHMRIEGMVGMTDDEIRDSLNPMPPVAGVVVYECNGTDIDSINGFRITVRAQPDSDLALWRTTATAWQHVAGSAVISPADQGTYRAFDGLRYRRIVEIENWINVHQ